jgi:hypothetical protein
MAIKKLLAATIIASVSGISNAGMISEWEYLNEAGFNTWNPEVTASNVGVNADLIPGTFTALSWGTGISNPPVGPAVINGGVDNLLSALVIDSPQSGTVGTNGAYVQGTPISHENWVVGTPSLTSATMLDALRLVPTALDGVATDFTPLVINAPVIEFNIDFIETTNHVDYGFGTYGFPTASTKIVDTTVECPNGEMNGSGANVNGCADIFVISTDTPGANFYEDAGNLFFDISFNFNSIPDLADFQYTLTTKLSGLTSIILEDDACQSVGRAAGCTGFATEEESTNRLNAEYKITATQIVPEPGSIAIFALGLLGLVASRKRS